MSSSSEESQKQGFDANAEKIQWNESDVKTKTPTNSTKSSTSASASASAPSSSCSSSSSASATSSSSSTPAAKAVSTPPTIVRTVSGKDEDVSAPASASFRRDSRSMSMSSIGDAPPLTPEQQKLLDEFKTQIRLRVPDDTNSDFTYLRFIRARKWKISEALEMFTNYLKWRKEANVDDILENPPVQVRELLARVVPESFHKFDKYGFPAYFMKAGKTNVDLLLRFVPVEDMYRTHLWGMEYSFQRGIESSQKFGRHIDRFCNVVDLDGLSMGHRAALKYIQHIAKLDNMYYPETNAKTYIINAPWIFGTLWNLAKGWIDPVTREKIYVLGSDYKKVLRERFNLEDLPEEYGGKCHCEGGCIKQYSEEDVHKYIAELEAKLDLHEVHIPAGKHHELTFNAGQFGATFEYYFKTVKGEIGFQAYFKYEDKTMKDRQWQKHVKLPGKEPNKGTFVTDFPGTAVFIFDNKHSWMATETLKYHFNVTPGVEGVKKEFHSGHEHDDG